MGKIITAVSRRNNKYQAVSLRRRGRAYELLRFVDCQISQTGWQEFCRVAVDGLGGGGVHRSKQTDIIASFDTDRTAFYRVGMPTVAAEQTESVVLMQAETLLPLPVEQMKIAWRAGANDTNQAKVTIAAARNDLLQSIGREIESYKPAKMVLQNEAIIAGWKELFGGGHETAVVIYIDQTNTKICLANEGRLTHSYTSDVGRDNLLGADRVDPGYAEQLAQDIYHYRSKMIDSEESAAVYLLSDGTGFMAQVADLINTADLEVIPVEPVTDIIIDQSGDDSAELSQNIYDYLVPLSLAVIWLDEKDGLLDIFGRLTSRAKTDEKKFRVPPLWLSGTVVVLAAGFLILASYGNTYSQLKITERNLEITKQAVSEAYPDLDVAQWQDAQKIKQGVAEYRANALDVLRMIHDCTPGDILIDSIDCKTGAPIALKAHTKKKGRSKLDEYEDKLRAYKGVKTVRIANQSWNEKAKKMSFSVTFEYKKFKKRQ